MELLFEIGMGVFFDAAAFFLTLRLARGEEGNLGRCRLLAAIFAVGFLCGILAACFAGASLVVPLLFTVTVTRRPVEKALPSW